MKRKLGLAKATKVGPADLPQTLLSDVRSLIVEARVGVARAVNAGLVTLYWHIGRRIRQDILKEKRAGYGQEIVVTLSRQLVLEFGRGFDEKNLRRRVQLAEVFSDREKLHEAVRLARARLEQRKS